jgi:hypothetical protein
MLYSEIIALSLSLSFSWRRNKVQDNLRPHYQERRTNLPTAINPWNAYGPKDRKCVRRESVQRE